MGEVEQADETNSWYAFPYVLASSFHSLHPFSSANHILESVALT